MQSSSLPQAIRGSIWVQGGREKILLSPNPRWLSWGDHAGRPQSRQSLDSQGKWKGKKLRLLDGNLAQWKSIPLSKLGIERTVFELKKLSIIFSGTRSEAFSLRTGTRQGRVLSPVLFYIVLVLANVIGQGKEINIIKVINERVQSSS